jgi:hypothetical protein
MNTFLIAFNNLKLKMWSKLHDKNVINHVIYFYIGSIVGF